MSSILSSAALLYILAVATTSNAQPNDKETASVLLFENSAITTNSSSGGKNVEARMRDMALYLNAHQRDLIRRNPGSLLAVARAFKLAIAECQYQMRHEPWDCPIYGFSIKPTDIFGKLMSRNFRETSFIHSLLSSAITHSITRACTESMITTCGRKRTRDGGFKEDIEFGSQFAQQFMKATHESSAVATAPANNNIDRILNNNIIVTESGAVSEPKLSQQTAGSTLDPLERERRIRYSINAHNDEVGRLDIEQTQASSDQTINFNFRSGHNQQSMMRACRTHEQTLYHANFVSCALWSLVCIATLQQ